MDLAWKNGRLTSAVIHSEMGQPCTVSYGDKTVELKVGKGKRFILGVKNGTILPAPAGTIGRAK